MFIWIAFFFALLAGVLAGLYAGLLHCKNRGKRAEKPTQTNAQKEKKRRWTAKLTRLLHRSHKPKQENADLLQKKIAHSMNSTVRRMERIIRNTCRTCASRRIKHTKYWQKSSPVSQKERRPYAPPFCVDPDFGILCSDLYL